MGGGNPTGIDSLFDMFSWDGLLMAIAFNFFYGGLVDTLVYCVEMLQFIGWYGFDSNMAAGSAVFLFGGFDLIGGKYFWGLFD